MDAHLPDVHFTQCSTTKTRDIKWTHICLRSTLLSALPPKTREIKWTQICRMSTLINALPPKARDIKWTHICQMSALINALPRKLVILNERTFA